MKQKQLVPFILLSLLIHLLMVLFVRFVKIPVFKSGPKLAEPIWIDLKEKEYQLVDIQPPVQEERPEDSRFLGAYDSRVSEEMSEEGALRSSVGDQKKKIKSDLHPLDSDKKKLLVSSRTSQQTGGGGISFEDSDLREEYPDAKKGPHTYLNVFRFLGSSYFIRIIRVARPTWNPNPSLEELHGNQLSEDKVVADVAFAIDSQGKLAELFLVKSSGINAYDQEALRTIRASAPFASLPKEISPLVDKDGLLRCHWTFTVHLIAPTVKSVFLQERAND